MDGIFYIWINQDPLLKAWICQWYLELAYEEHYNHCVNV